MFSPSLNCALVGVGQLALLEVAGEPLHALGEVLAVGLDRALEHDRVHQREVRRAHRVEHALGGEAQLLALAARRAPRPRRPPRGSARRAAGRSGGSARTPAARATRRRRSGGPGAAGATSGPSGSPACGPDAVLREHVLPQRRAFLEQLRLALRDRASGICWYQPCIRPIHCAGSANSGTGISGTACCSWNSSHICCSLSAASPHSASAASVGTASPPRAARRHHLPRRLALDAEHLGEQVGRGGLGVGSLIAPP